MTVIIISYQFQVCFGNNNYYWATCCIFYKNYAFDNKFDNIQSYDILICGPASEISIIEFFFVLTFEQSLAETIIKEYYKLI